MKDLRTALIIIGVLFVVGLMLWERRRATRRTRAMQPEPSATVIPPMRRVEPSIVDYAGTGSSARPDTLEVPIIHPMDPVRVDVMKGAAVDIPSAARQQPPRMLPDEPPAAEPLRVSAAIHWPPARTERVLSLRVVRAGGEPLPGRALRSGLESAGMVHGPQAIYHLVDAAGNVLGSVANLVRPGSFSPVEMDTQEFRGLSVFSILPGPMPAMQMLDGLVRLAQGIAASTGAVVQDEKGAVLDSERLGQMRNSVRAYAETASDSPP